MRNWVLSRDSTTCRSEYIHETLQNRHETNELHETLKSERATGDCRATGADTVDHYGDLKGSNRLGDQRLGVLLGCQHHGHGAVEQAATFAHQDATPTGRGIEQSYGSAVSDAYLRYMWHDSVMQAALRFGRDPEIDETVVVAHTAALREDLPVVAEGEVVKTYSAGEKRVAEAVADLRGSFTTADVRERLAGDANPRSVRRQLAALVKAGHLDRTETPNGVATQFSDPEAPGAGQVKLPSVGDAHPDDPTQCISYTWSVRVSGGDTGGSRHRPVARATLPSPDTAAAAVVTMFWNQCHLTRQAPPLNDPLDGEEDGRLEDFF